MESRVHVRPPVYLERIEDAILAVLKEGVDGSAKVESFPADPATYDMAGLGAAVLVHYAGSRFAPRGGPVDSNQARRVNFAVVILARSLRGQGGSYALLEDVRQALQGERFEGAGPAEMVTDRLVEEAKGLWRWEIMIGLNAPAVARNRQEPRPLMRPTIGVE